MKAPVARMAAILAASGDQSSSRSIADQIASTSAMTMVSGRRAAADGRAAAREAGGGRERAQGLDDLGPGGGLEERAERARAQPLGQAAAEEVVEDLLEGRRGLLHRAPEAVHQRARRLGLAGEEAEAGEGLAGERGLEALGEAVEDRLDRGAGGERDQALAEAGEVPVQRLGLAGEGVEAGLVEVGGGEGRVEAVEEAPGAVVEALAGDR